MSKRKLPADSLSGQTIEMAGETIHPIPYKHQQGDVQFFAIADNEIPKGAVQLDHNRAAEGEATGHFHGLEGKDITVFEVTEGAVRTRYARLPHGGKVVHQEHKAFELDPGTYRIRLVREYDHLKQLAREVRD